MDELRRREFLALAQSGVIFQSGPNQWKRIVISVNVILDIAAHSGKGLTPAEIARLSQYQKIAAGEFAISGIFFDLHTTGNGYLHEQGYSDIPDKFLLPKMINLFVTDSLGYDIDHDRTGGSSMGPRPRTRAFARSAYYKTFLGLNQAHVTTLPHEFAHHFTLDTQHGASLSGNLWADLRNDYWLWRQRHGIPIPQFRECANSEWARVDL